MDLDAPAAWLGGLTPAGFMRRHWHKRPLLVRQAGLALALDRARLFALAASDEVESRLVLRQGGAGWRLRHGPLARRALPPLKQRGWTLLVQGVDLHLAGAQALLAPFGFIPHARLDDLMVSWASDGGGVGPHLDSYEVFLIQLQGRRRWRVGRVADPQWRAGAPLKVLRRFEPEHDWLLEPGDLLYLPPRWGHDGVAEGECMTASVGFRSPSRGELARELLPRLAEGTPDDARLYADPRQAAAAAPGAVPPALLKFAEGAVRKALRQPDALACALGEWLSEPKPKVWFETRDAAPPAAVGLRLDRRSRMLYDERHVYLNGESWRCRGRDAQLLRRLADRRELGAGDRARLGPQAQSVVGDWLAAGWLTEDER